jgi:hypothetical protein
MTRNNKRGSLFANLIKRFEEKFKTQSVFDFFEEPLGEPDSFDGVGARLDFEIVGPLGQ